MRNLLKKPWFVGVLALSAFVFVGHSVLSKNSGASGGYAPPVTEDGVADVADADASNTTGAQGDVAAALKELSGVTATRDPFASRAKAAAVAVAAAVEKIPEPDVVDTVRLTALWTQDGVTFALINGRVCQVGDRIGRLKVETANQDGIWVAHWKGRDFISIGGAFTLVTPARQAVALSLSQGG